MADAGGGFAINTVEDVFRDFQARRAGLLKALTTDFRNLYDQCDPNTVNLSLFGHPNRTWEVKMPVDALPPKIPEPVVGINFARDGETKREWRCHVAGHSDIWLLSVAFYHGGKLRFNNAQRNRLFTMINDLPTLMEIVSGEAEKQRRRSHQHRTVAAIIRSQTPRLLPESQRKHPKTPPDENDEDDKGSEEEGVDGDEYDDVSSDAC